MSLSSTAASSCSRSRLAATPSEAKSCLNPAANALSMISCSNCDRASSTAAAFTFSLSIRLIFACAASVVTTADRRSSACLATAARSIFATRLATHFQRRSVARANTSAKIVSIASAAAELASAISLAAAVHLSCRRRSWRLRAETTRAMAIRPTAPLLDDAMRMV